MRLYNTLTRSVEEFAPADGRTVRMYTCGPTVYNPAHLGNFRTFLFEDLLRRTLRYVCGYEVQQVMNLTDVDDKIIARAAEQRVTISELTAPVIERFHSDREYLGIEAAELYPRATQYIPQMIGLVQRLQERGLAYLAEDGSVYFAIGRFPSYGRLSRLDTREIRAGARVAQDDYSKENAQDFALWKAAKAEDEATGAAWDSPWGRGRPGWHLECSAMAMEELGETLDIHCGGVDLVFPHHEDEIAQSEGATGRPFARFWCHGAFLLTEGAKMAKRVGNVWTVADLRSERVSRYALRHFVFSTHYRKELNLVREAIDASGVATRKLGHFQRRLAGLEGAPAELGELARRAEGVFREALLDDLNAPEALAALFTFMRQANPLLDRGGEPGAAQQALATLELMDSVLGVVDRTVSEAEAVVALRLEPRIGAVAHVDEGRSAGKLAPTAELLFDPAVLDEGRMEWLSERLLERHEARRRRDFALSDRVRDELREAGFQVEDSGGGQKVRLSGG